MKNEKPIRMSWWLYIIFFALSLAWCTTILSLPWIVHSGCLKVAFAISLLFSNICHQNPSRSFSLLGITLPVCIRCTGIYLGSLPGIVVFPWLRNISMLSIKLKYLTLLATILLVVDIGFDILGIWSNTWVSRSLGGAFFGFSFTLYLVSAIQEFLKERKQSERPQSKFKS